MDEIKPDATHLEQGKGSKADVDDQDRPIELEK